MIYPDSNQLIHKVHWVTIGQVFSLLISSILQSHYEKLCVFLLEGFITKL